MVAEAASYSYYHFHRYFALVMGETIGSYITPVFLGIRR